MEKIGGKKMWDAVRQSMVETVGEDEFSFGRYYSFGFKTDIKHLMISFARYKFISKLFRFKESYRMLELGCSEGVGALFFTQLKNCECYRGIDFDEGAIEWAKENLSNESTEFLSEDFLNKEYGKYDVVVSVDVIEHIDKKIERDYIDTVWKNLNNNGTAIIGTPNIVMDAYASAASKQAHVNLFSQKRLYDLCKEKFDHVFIFNMNDEIVHTGMDEMSCYIFAVCCGKII